MRRYLAQERGLDPRLLRLCRRARILYADRRGNAVFVCRDPARAVTGAEIVGTRPGNAFKAMAPGSRKRRGGFWLPHAPPPLRSALLAESAIDALSAQQLLDPRRRCPALFLSTAGVASRLPPWLPPFRCQLLFCGYDNDAAGDRAANALGRRHPALLRLRPPADANDWNDHLRTTRA